MTDEEKERIAEIAKIVVAEIKEEEAGRPRCSWCLDQTHMEDHARQHAFIKDWMGFLDRVNNIRWSIVRNVLSGAVMAFVILVGTLLWRHFRGE